MPSKTADPVAGLSAAIAKIEKNLGKGMFHKAQDGPPVYHLPFLNYHLNRATEGGAPWNRFVALYGDESTGKSLAAYQLMAQAQGLPYTAEVSLMPRIRYHRELGHTQIVARLVDEMEWIEANFPNGAECAFYDIEGQFDKLRAAKIGVDIDRLWISETDVLEDICGTFSVLAPHIHLHVFDSTSNANSMLTLKHEPGKSLMGVEARQWKSSLRSASSYFGPAKNSTGIPNMLVMIHQMATNIQTGGSQAAVGKYLKFVSSCSIRFSRGRFLWEKDGVLVEDKPTGADDDSMAGRAEADGVAVHVKIEKSRTCRPFREGAMQFSYDKLTYVPIHELATSGLYYGLITKSGSWFSIPGEEKNIGQGLKAVYARLADDEELRDRIMCRMLDFSNEG